jgi:hypothetical protein
MQALALIDVGGPKHMHYFLGEKAQYELCQSNLPLKAQILVGSFAWLLYVVTLLRLVFLAKLDLIFNL